MNQPEAFLNEVLAFSGKEIPEQTVEIVDKLTAQDFFNFETMKGKSIAAAYLAGWVVNIVIFHKIYLKVAPLMAEVAEATAAKDAAEEALAVVIARVEAVEAEVADLNQQMEEAIRIKTEVEADAEMCMSKLALAEQL